VIIEHRGRAPVIPESAWVAPSAVVSGDVSLGERVRVLHGAVLTSDGGSIEIGSDVVVMENALVRGRPSHPCWIGDAVLIGPHAHINGATIEDEVFLATGVSVFPGAVAETRSELRINSVLHVNSRLPAGAVLPIGWIGAGDPAELFAPERHQELWEVQRRLDFARTVYRADPATPMRHIMTRQVEFYGAHRDDRTL
jgi:carbonic anhydrase/acetyltransferase-like protein (isoleucine patch superfamily)